MKSYRVTYEHEGVKKAIAVCDVANHLACFSSNIPGIILMIEQMKVIAKDTWCFEKVVYCVDDSLLPKHDDRIREMTSEEVALLLQQMKNKVL